MLVADKTPWKKDIQVAEKAGQVTLWVGFIYLSAKWFVYIYLETCLYEIHLLPNSGPVPSPTPTARSNTIKRSFMMLSQKKIPHARKDCLEDGYKTGARLVEDKVRDATVATPESR